MSLLHPVLWTKGTLLTPQHLQAQDRYFDEILRQHIGALAFSPWGFSQLEIDREALAGGTVVVRSASGRFPDGLLFDAPAADPCPAPRSLDGAWVQDQRSMLVFLIVPEFRAGTRNVTGSSGDGGALAQARWRAEEQLTTDETTGLAERPIQVARPNLRLQFEGEFAEGNLSLPIARLLRSASGEVAFDPAYVPPLISLAASPVLSRIVRHVVERVAARAAALSATRRQRNQGLADFSSTDVGSFWLLFALNTHLPQLRHLQDVRGGHPSELWGALVALAGALSTFSSSAPVIPPYDHMRLGECFGTLQAQLIELLDTAVPENVIALPLRTIRPSVQAVSLAQESLLKARQWFLAVSAPMRQADLINKVLTGCKVGSADVVDTLIRQAMPGLQLTHVADPPAAVPVKLDFLYFTIDRNTPAWEAVARAGNLAVYVPAELADARLELVIVLR
jgi:type VI secretion system protein ImpJ